jgi:hypothetical protein
MSKKQSPSNVASKGKKGKEKVDGGGPTSTGHKANNKQAKNRAVRCVYRIYQFPVPHSNKKKIVHVAGT